MTKSLKRREQIELYLKEEAEICDKNCPHPSCSKGVCAFYNAEVAKLREKYGKKRG